MIERYTRTDMKRVWSEDNKYDRWLDVEMAVCEAWTDEGVIPQEDMEKLRGVTYNKNRQMDHPFCRFPYKPDC